MRRLGPFVNMVFCTVIGIAAAQVGVRLMGKLFIALMRSSWFTRDDALLWVIAMAIAFAARGIVAVAAPIVSAYLLAHRWPVLGKWPVPAVVSAVLSVAISLKWAAYELSINRFWP